MAQTLDKMRDHDELGDMSDHEIEGLKRVLGYAVEIIKEAGDGPVRDIPGIEEVADKCFGQLEFIV